MFPREYFHFQRHHLSTIPLNLKQYKPCSCGYTIYTTGYSGRCELPKPRRVFCCYYVSHYEDRVGSDIMRCERICFVFVSWPRVVKSADLLEIYSDVRFSKTVLSPPVPPSATRHIADGHLGHPDGGESHEPPLTFVEDLKCCACL